jgi:glyceraldehyde-3-phosphate dehydrogenase (NADP+)
LHLKKIDLCLGIAMSQHQNAFIYDNLFYDESDATQPKPPYLHGDYWLVNGEIRKWTGPLAKVNSPIFIRGKNEPIRIGVYPMLTEKESVEAVNAAVAAFDYGRGEWPRMTTKSRIAHVKKFVAGLKEKREEIVNLLMWEICKPKADSEKEFDRTIVYIEDTIKALKKLENEQSTFVSDGGIIGQIRRSPYGVVLCAGPFNYPFNETYTTLIPALIMGNTVIMKLPRVGVLCHFPTFEIFQRVFPRGVINVISGSGHATVPPCMATGKIDVFAFIGTSQAADAIQKAHPKPHRLRVCLGLEAKNPAIILPDADLNVAVEECVLGSLSFNGQRCTAIKIVFVHESIADKFLEKFAAAVDSLKMGLPWQKDVKITPLPEQGKPDYLTNVIEDALAKGANIVNKCGGRRDRTFVAPTVLFSVKPTMKVYLEEQFGPVVPVTTYSDLQEIFEYLASSPYGQQAAVFGQNTEQLAMLIDVLVNQVCRVNINCQCQRGPDSFPFTGRKDSAYGTLSVFDALRVFSIRSLVATKDTPANAEILSNIVDSKKSNFLRMDYIF